MIYKKLIGTLLNDKCYQQHANVVCNNKLNFVKSTIIVLNAFFLQNLHIIKRTNRKCFYLQIVTDKHLQKAKFVFLMNFLKLKQILQ